MFRMRRGVINSAAAVTNYSKNRILLTSQQQPHFRSLTTTTIVRRGGNKNHLQTSMIGNKTQKMMTPPRRTFAGGHHGGDRGPAVGPDGKYLEWPVMPVPQSMQGELFPGRVNEGWEWTIAWWYTSSFLIISAIMIFQPEDGIDVWAAREAQARLDLKAQGFTDFEFGKHYQDVQEEKMKSAWDVFASKAFAMNDDDDDDEDEEEEEEAEEEEDE